MGDQLGAVVNANLEASRLAASQNNRTQDLGIAAGKSVGDALGTIGEEHAKEQLRQYVKSKGGDPAIVDMGPAALHEWLTTQLGTDPASLAKYHAGVQEHLQKSSQDAAMKLHTTPSPSEAQDLAFGQDLGSAVKEPVAGEMPAPVNLAPGLPTSQALGTAVPTSRAPTDPEIQRRVMGGGHMKPSTFSSLAATGERGDAAAARTGVQEKSIDERARARLAAAGLNPDDPANLNALGQIKKQLADASTSRAASTATDVGSKVDHRGAMEKIGQGRNANAAEGNRIRDAHYKFLGEIEQAKLAVSRGGNAEKAANDLARVHQAHIGTLNKALAAAQNAASLASDDATKASAVQTIQGQINEANGAFKDAVEALKGSTAPPSSPPAVGAGAPPPAAPAGLDPSAKARFDAATPEQQKAFLDKASPADRAAVGR